MNFKIDKVHRWTDHNEYEGQLEGHVQGLNICPHLLVFSVDEWKQCKPGAEINLDLWLERNGRVTKLNEPGTKEVKQENGINYLVSGPVVEIISNEEIRIQSTIELRVDLDLSEHSEFTIPKLAVGDWIRVDGCLKAELE